MTNPNQPEPTEADLARVSLLLLTTVTRSEFLGWLVMPIVPWWWHRSQIELKHRIWLWSYSSHYWVEQVRGGMVPIRQHAEASDG